MIKKLLIGLTLIACILAAAFTWWARQPILAGGETIHFTIQPGSGLISITQQIAEAGVPVNPAMLALLARITSKSKELKAGSYDLKPGASPLRLIDQLARGEFAQETLVIIEGWTFRQMRKAIARHPALKHDTTNLSDAQLLAKVATDYEAAEGLFLPDTYLFATGASDLQIYKQAHAMLLKHLNAAWEQRDLSLPYKTPYEALIMASIVEKETGKASDRTMVSAVFINRLKRGMLLQTDPTVIYGMGDAYKGNIRKSDLTTDTPYNTYTRVGLPPTPIALPGRASLAAAFAPAATDAMYFVGRGDGSTHFSTNLNDHNKAVNKFQRGIAAK